MNWASRKKANAICERGKKPKRCINPRATRSCVKIIIYWKGYCFDHLGSGPNERKKRLSWNESASWRSSYMQTGRVKELDRMPEQLREARRHRDTIEQVVLNQLAEVKEKESLVLEMQTAADQAGYGSPLHDLRKFLSLQSTSTEIACRHRTERNKIVLPSMLRFLATARGFFLFKVSSTRQGMPDFSQTFSITP